MNKILIGILCIDRDHMNISKLYNSLPKQHCDSNIDILVVTRKCDKRTIKKFNKYDDVKIIQVSNYKIIGRHNIDAIIKKRGIILKYATDNNYDKLLFVDSDIVLYENILIDMEKLSNESTIVCGIYPIKWANKKAIALCTDGKLKTFDQITPTDNLLIGGFGCCLIPKQAFNIKLECKIFELNSITLYGEDFGWFLNANTQNFVVKPLLTRIIEHNIRE